MDALVHNCHLSFNYCCKLKIILWLYLKKKKKKNKQLNLFGWVEIRCVRVGGHAVIRTVALNLTSMHREDSVKSFRIDSQF